MCNQPCSLCGDKDKCNLCKANVTSFIRALDWLANNKPKREGKRFLELIQEEFKDQKHDQENHNQ